MRIEFNQRQMQEKFSKDVANPRNQQIKSYDQKMLQDIIVRKDLKERQRSIEEAQKQYSIDLNNHAI
jgi:hypothetical protein